MNIFNFAKRCLLGLGFLAASGTSFAATKPNIIFFIADDLGYGDVGCYGQKKILTPNIDRLAAEGMKFTQHYAGSPVCAPSRCVLMTGKHPGHAFIRNNREMKPEGQFPIPAETVTIAKLLKQSGYATGAFGKWGLGFFETTGSPLKQGFDRFYGYNCQAVAHNLYPTYVWDNDKRVELPNVALAMNQKLPEVVDINDAASYKKFTGKKYAPDLYAEQALAFIRDNKARPFFLFFPTVVPHLSLQVPDEELKKYEGKFPETPYAGGKGYLPQRTPRAAYAAMISRMDAELGRMMKLVSDLGLDENTIFIFTSDNGPAPDGMGGIDREFFNSNGLLRAGKMWIYEGGIREPMIVRWKGKIKAGEISERVTGFEDWLPTLLDVIGEKEKTPDKIDGISFAPALFGKNMAERPFLYREYAGNDGQQSIRVGDWKTVRVDLKTAEAKTGKLRMELYNLKNDLGETKDVSADEPQILARLEKLMREQHTPSKDFPMAVLDK